MIAGIDSTYRSFGIGRASVRLLSYSLFEGRPLTTRGRWINPLVFALSLGLTNARQLKEVSKPIFIVGTGRSGTTILGLTLSMHASVGFLNEPKALWHRAFPDEDIIGNYSAQPGRYLLEERDATEDVITRFHKLYGGYLRISCRDRILDKYPEALFRIPFLLHIFPDAKFVWLVRNGNDTISSIMKWSGQHGTSKNGQIENWWGRDDRKWQALVKQVCSKDRLFADVVPELHSLDRDVDRAAVEWTTSVNCGLRAQEKWPDRILRVNFEALSSDSKLSLKSILDFCELDNDPDVFEYAKLKLAPVGHYEPPELASLVQAPFAETMHSVGFPTNGSSKK